MKGKDIYMYILGAIIVLAELTIIALLVFYEIPESNRDILNIVLGALISAFMNVIGYFYGSSKGSADKTELISKQNGEKPQ